MLEPEGNAILIAQNKIAGAASESIDLSGNTEPDNIAFSAELTRAQDSISDQTAEPEQTIVTAVEPNNIVGNKVIPSGTQGSKAPSLVSQAILGGSSASSQNVSVTQHGIDDVETTQHGVLTAQETQSPIDMLANLDLGNGEAKQIAAPNKSIDPDLSLHSDIEPLIIEVPESSSTVDDSNLVSGLKTATVTPAAVQMLQGGVVQTPVIEQRPVEVESEALNIASKTVPNAVPNVVLNTAMNTVPASIAPADLSFGDKQEIKTTAQVLNVVPEKVMSGERPVTVPVEIDKVAEVAKRAAITDRLTTSQATAFTETTEVTKVGPQTTEITAVGNQAANIAIPYKPSPGLIQSGLGRTSVELNNGVSLGTPASARVTESELSSPPVLLNPLVSSGVVSSSITEEVSDDVAKLPGADQVRAIGNGQSVPNDERLSNALRTTATIVNPDESRQSGSFQAVNNPASPIALANTPPQIPLAEIALPKGGANIVETADVTSSNTDTTAKIIGDTNSGSANFGGGESKNPHQQLAQAAVTAVDEDVALTQSRESVADEQQNKFSNVTPGVNLRQVVKPDQSANIASLQSLSGTAELTSSNVYHATSNGIITAHSTPLNTGLVTDLASAPRTVPLDQPIADESLLENLRWVVNEKLSRATINVSPANLGPITVSVDVENQNMNVSIIANNTIAKDAIDSLLPRIREHFGSEGYQQVSVDVSSQQERQGNLRNQSGFSLEQESGSEADTRDADTRDKELVREEKRATFEGQRTSQSLIDTYV